MTQITCLISLDDGEGIRRFNDFNRQDYCYPNSRLYGMYNALGEAISGCCIQAVKALLEHPRIDPSKVHSDRAETQPSALYLTMSLVPRTVQEMETLKRIFQILVNCHKVDVNGMAEYQGNESVFMAAIRHQDIFFMQTLARCIRINVNKESRSPSDVKRHLPLLEAIDLNKMEAVRLLLNHPRCVINFPQQILADGWDSPIHDSPLAYCVAQVRFQFIETLLEAGANVHHRYHIKDVYGFNYSASMYEINYGMEARYPGQKCGEISRMEVAEMLCRAGADPTLSNKFLQFCRLKDIPAMANIRKDEIRLHKLRYDIPRGPLDPRRMIRYQVVEKLRSAHPEVSTKSIIDYTVESLPISEELKNYIRSADFNKEEFKTVQLSHPLM